MSLPSSADLETRLALLPIDAVEAELRRREQRVAGVAQDQSLEASKERCKTLGGFIREAWHLVEPMMPLIWNWHIDAICDHLEAVTRGDIIRLLINVPPGTMKSLIVSVFWPAWEWGPAGLPSMRYFTTSYKLEGLADRDSRKMRDLVRSEWFQERWGSTCALTRTGESDFEKMSDLAKSLRDKLATLTLGAPQIPVLNNIDVAIETDADRIRDALYRQAFGPVRWVECVQAIKARGVSTLVECGPGKVLAGMTKRIDAELNGVALYDPATLAEVKGLLA